MRIEIPILYFLASYGGSETYWSLQSSGNPLAFTWLTQCISSFHLFYASVLRNVDLKRNRIYAIPKYPIHPVHLYIRLLLLVLRVLYSLYPQILHRYNT